MISFMLKKRSDQELDMLVLMQVISAFRTLRPED
jgi:hypothetical protein